MKKRTIFGLGASAVLGLVGGIVAVFFSPSKGEERRAAVKDKVRRERANVAAMFGGPSPADANQAVKDAILFSLREVFGKGAELIEVTVHRGVVTVRGEVDHLVDIEEAESVIRSIDAVRDVNNLLRLRDAESKRPAVKGPAAKKTKSAASSSSTD